MPPSSAFAIARNLSITGDHIHQEYALKQNWGHADDLNDWSVQLPRRYVEYPRVL